MALGLSYSIRSILAHKLDRATAQNQGAKVESADILNKLNVELASVRASGQSAVDIDALQKYIEYLRTHHAASSDELRKLEQQRSLAYFDAQTKHSIEMFKSVIDAGREALNALVLVNGGAVVALLGFMGATISKGFPASLGMQLTRPVLFFGLGVLMGVVGFGVRYLGQACYAGQRNTLGTVFNVTSSFAAVVGYALFGSGVYAAYSAFVAQFAS